MNTKQISVFLENKPGAVYAMTQVLAENGIDMRAFSLAEASDFGIARIIVDDIYKTTTVLKDAGFVNSVSSVLAVSLTDQPGALAQALAVLADAGINVEYMYAFLSQKTAGAYMVFRVSDAEEAAAALTSRGFTLLDQDDLTEL